MKAKNNLVLLLLVIFLISCAKKEEKNTPLASSSLKKALFNPGDYSLNEAEVLYIEEVGKSSNNDNVDYIDYLKQMGFILLMDKGLAENGSKEQKLYFLYEQINAESNLPNITNFFKLLHASSDIFTVEEMQKISDEFTDKNLALINKMEWKHTDIKEEKEKELISNQRNFIRTLNREQVSIN